MSRRFFVTAILVAHDGATWLTEAVAGISSQERRIDRIIAVDTGSVDSSPKMLTNAGFTLLELPRDTGFGAAIERGLQALPPIDRNEEVAAELGTQEVPDFSELSDEMVEEWIWILHDDCAPHPQALAELLNALHDRPRTAMVGPKICGWQDRSTILEVGVSITGSGRRWTGLENNEPDQGQHDELKEVLAVSSAGALIKRSLFEEIGGFDPELNLFRDDVDLGWRIHTAGYSVVCAPMAKVFHAEAAARERRSIDVSEAFLHRPLLLDRNHAAYVLLANSSWWLLPFVAILLMGAAAVRAVGYLLAKLPGYAGDEIAAVALLILKPQEIIKARRDRKTHRVISPRVLKEFVPPKWVQARSYIDKAVNALRNRFAGANVSGFSRLTAQAESSGDRAQDYADIGLIDESFDEIAPSRQSQVFSALALLIRRPLFLVTLLLGAISLIAARHRFGVLSGGALLSAHPGASDLFSIYGSSWHALGMGSRVAAPMWIPLVGLASFVTLGNVQLFITFFFLSAILLIFFTFYRVAKNFSLRWPFAIAGALVYSLSPVVLTSINQGRLGTLVAALVIPILSSAMRFTVHIDSMSWRRVAGLILLVTVLGAFVPLLLVLWSGLQVVLIVIALYVARSRFTASYRELFRWWVSQPFFAQRVALVVGPFLLLIPGSLGFLFHPSRLLLESGLSVGSNNGWNIALLNPGGAGSPPWWMITPALFMLIISLGIRKTERAGLAAISLTSLAMILSSWQIFGHGSAVRYPIWTGGILLLAMLISILPLLHYLQDFIPRLPTLSFGWRHMGISLAAALSAISLVFTAGWSITGGSSSVVRSQQTEIVPPFLTALAKSPQRPKTLVIRKFTSHIGYFITRGDDLRFGESDILGTTPQVLQNAITTLINGAGTTTNKILGAHGISYIFIKNPADPTLVRNIDGIGGYVRSSASRDGIIWRVIGASPRVTFTNLKGVNYSLESKAVSATVTLQSPGTVTLAENFDSGWKALLNGQQLELHESPLGLPQFNATTAGTLSISFDGTKRRALLSLQFIFILIVIVLALPAGRRRSEIDYDGAART